MLGQLVQLQVKLVATTKASIADLDRAIALAVMDHPKTVILQTLPRIGKVNLAQVLAEVGPILERSLSCQQASDNSRHSSAWAEQLYKSARAKGKRHPHAVRILMRAWMPVIWKCWHSEVSYDPANYGGERRLAAQVA